MAVTATFTPSAGILSVFGDALADEIIVGRNAAGTIHVNGGAVPVKGGAPTVANTSLIQVFGRAGDDIITIDESNGAMPRANIFGGAGNDTITGGSGNDQLFGEAGNDILFGKGGDDFLFGGAGDDVLVGGAGNDFMFGEAGDDRMIWNPGDGTDVMEGGDGIDTAEVNGGNGAEVFTVTANGTRVRFDRLDPAPFALDIGTTEHLVVNMGGGNDFFSATGNLAALISITVDGGAGDDTILGSNGADLLIGGDGDDFIDGQQGNDTILLGAGNDTFQWDPGDGSDLVDGGSGFDTMLFNGSAANEIFDIAANGERVRFTRNVGNIVMDLNEVEKITVNALGGADTVIVNDLTGTDVTEVVVNLAGTLGGAAGDSATDTVIVNATAAGDTIDVLGLGNSVAVIGTPASVTINTSEGANDSLVINALGGNDRLDASTLGAGLIKLTLDGGAGDDTIIGSAGADVLLGGDGDDVIEGRQGNDVALLGAGNDLFVWNPGDGSDVVEGQAGTDTLRFNGSNAAENIDILANGGRALLFRNVGNVTMDLDDVEVIEVNALGGADTIVVGDLTGTDVTKVKLNLAGAGGSSDGQADAVTVNGTQNADTFGAVGTAGSGSVTVFGLQAAVELTGVEGALDRLTLNGLGGDDVIDASGLQAGLVSLTINGGLGNDVLIGSEGDDVITGGDGNDLALMGDGDDTFIWNPGDDNDTVEGGAGFDTLRFNGANVAENIDISANGDRVRFFRNVANVTIDLDDVEKIQFNALGGADTIVVNDLTGTDVTEVVIDLAAAGGGGDAQADTVILNATGGDDVIVVTGNGSEVLVQGLAYLVRILNFDSGLDRLVINALAGDDVIEASGVSADSILLTLNGGDGNDVLIGGAGNDVLLGGPGDDVLIGGPGLDILDGGPGDNILIQ